MGVFQFFSEPDGLETAVTSYLSIDGRCDISKFFLPVCGASLFSSGSDILRHLMDDDVFLSYIHRIKQNKDNDSHQLLARK